MGLFKRKEKEEKLSRGEQFNQDANEYLDFVHSLGPNAIIQRLIHREGWQRK